MGILYQSAKLQCPYTILVCTNQLLPTSQDLLLTEGDHPSPETRTENSYSGVLMLSVPSDKMDDDVIEIDKVFSRVL